MCLACRAGGKQAQPLVGAVHAKRLLRRAVHQRAASVAAPELPQDEMASNSNAKVLLELSIPHWRFHAASPGDRLQRDSACSHLAHPLRLQPLIVRYAVAHQHGSAWYKQHFAHCNTCLAAAQAKLPARVCDAGSPCVRTTPSRLCRTIAPAACRCRFAWTDASSCCSNSACTVTLLEAYTGSGTSCTSAASCSSGHFSSCRQLRIVKVGSCTATSCKSLRPVRARCAHTTHF